MLILARHVNESIRIGDIQVKITRMEHDKVWLGIDAPKDVEVHREEIYQTIQAERNFKIAEEQE